MKNLRAIVCWLDCCHGLMAGRPAVILENGLDSLYYNSASMLTRHRNYGMPFVDVPGDWVGSLGYRRKCKLSADSLMRWNPTAMRVSGTAIAYRWMASIWTTQHRFSCTVSPLVVDQKNHFISFKVIIIDCDWLLLIHLRWVICNQSMRICVHSHWAPSFGQTANQMVLLFIFHFRVFFFSFFYFFRRSLTHWAKWTVYCIHIVRNYHYYHFTFTVWWPTSLKRWSHAGKTKRAHNKRKWLIQFTWKFRN